MNILKVLPLILSTSPEETLAESVSVPARPVAPRRGMPNAHAIMMNVYKRLDAMDLIGTNGETDHIGICSLAGKEV